MIINVHKKLFKEETFVIDDGYPEGPPLLNLDGLKKFNKVALQIDGGGILGVLPAYQLYATQWAHKDLSINSLITDYYGTSTGSIITAALYLGISIDKVLQFYVEKGPGVFEDRTFFGKLFRRSLFKSEKLTKTLRELFGEVTFAEARKKRRGQTLNIATVSKLDNVTLICNHKNTPDMKIWQAVRASTAAPMYFPPFRYKDKVLVDGGTGTYNCLLEKALDAYIYDQKLNPKEYFILSLGCGSIRAENSNPTEKQIRRALKCTKAKSIIFALMYGRYETISRQVKLFNHLQKEMKINGMRWDIDLPKSLDKMADTDNINELIDLVDKE